MVDAVADLNSTATDSASCADVDGGTDEEGVCMCREGISELVGGSSCGTGVIKSSSLLAAVARLSTFTFSSLKGCFG